MNRDDIDIFAFNLGGSVSDMMRDPEEKSDPFLTEEQAAYFAAQLLPGAATVDATGNMPGMPSSNADLTDIFDAENNPSILENIRQGNILDPALQALGVLGDATYAIPPLGATLGTALKAPGALRKAMKMKESLSEATERLKAAYEAAPNSDDARRAYLKMRSARDAAGESASTAVDTSYRMSHQPTGPDGGARLDDMTGGGEVFPDDIYSSKGLQYYGNPGSAADKESYKVIQAMRGKPDKSVTVYRAVPPGVKEINPGDFVSLSKKYAEDHAFTGYGSSGQDAGDVISMRVKAKEVYSPGDDLNEFGYFPGAPSTASTGGIDSIPQNVAIASNNVEAIDAAKLVAAIERGTLVDGPIRTTPVFQELGIERVREIEAALKRQQGDLDSVEAMVQRANTVNPSFQANIDSVAKSVGGKKADKFIDLKDGSQFDVEVKTPKSIATKVERKGLAPADFTDGVRTTIYIDTADQAEEAVSQIGQMYTTIDRGWQRIPESGYFDRKMNVLVDDPATGKKIVAEIQIKTPEMFDAGEQGAHRWYDYSRKLEGRYNHEIPGTKLKLYNKALAEQRRLFGAAFDAADPAIVEQLVDKFMKGGVVEAGPRSFRISFQNWA